MIQLLVGLLVVGSALAQTAAPGSAPVSAPVQGTVPVPVTQPRVVPTPAVVPSVPAGAQAPPAVATVPPAAATPFPDYEENRYSALAASDKAVLLIFSQKDNAVSAQQTEALRQALQSQVEGKAEFASIEVLKVDLETQKDIATRFKVTKPGTMVMTKKGVERVRSNSMTKVEPIKKMLRLWVVL